MSHTTAYNSLGNSAPLEGDARSASPPRRRVTPAPKNNSLPSPFWSSAWSAGPTIAAVSPRPPPVTRSRRIRSLSTYRLNGSGRGPPFDSWSAGEHARSGRGRVLVIANHRIHRRPERLGTGAPVHRELAATMAGSKQEGGDDARAPQNPGPGFRPARSWIRAWPSFFLGLK